MSTHNVTPNGLYDKMSRRNMFLPDDLVDQLKTIASSHGLTFAELVRRVLSDYVKG